MISSVVQTVIWIKTPNFFWEKLEFIGLFCIFLFYFKLLLVFVWTPGGPAATLWKLMGIQMKIKE